MEWSYSCSAERKKVQRDWHLNEEQDSAAGDTGLLQMHTPKSSPKNDDGADATLHSAGEHRKRKRCPNPGGGREKLKVWIE